MNYKITNGKLLISENGHIRIEEKDLYVNGNKLSFAEDKSVTYETMDASHKLIMPGLINMHTHAYMSVLRNYADDVDFGEWLFNRCMPVEDRLPKDAAYWTNLLAFAEMIKSGTTTFVDMHMFHRQSPLAAGAAGMRGYIGRGLVGEDLYADGYSRFKEAIEEKEEFESDTMKFILSPHAIYSAGPKLMEQVVKESKDRGMLHQTHLSESVTEVEDCLKKYGKTPVELLRDIGFLDNETILAHCVQMRGDDMDILKETGATVVTNPASNAKLGNGFAPIKEMEEKGINLCVGTDGCASNNTLNMFREMGLLSLIHKGIHKSSTVMSAEAVVNFATVNAAKALHMEDKLGVIKEGAIADIIFLNLRTPSMYPENNPISALCYSANGSEVESVMINGKFVMKDNVLLTIDMDKVYYEVDKIVEKYL
ncbi:5-methylthioadenosine/S-adenosylhomocysteine deaminase [Lachnospiraceae bacterium YSD2013]|nr:5-methylthioadenosine/S-adenosylhomocysteine deaminase [Lachnospiraceae bacterium YSD2013]